MTKKHFAQIAELLNKHIVWDPEASNPPCSSVEDVARDMADLFKEFNPLFDVERFLKACGL